MRNRLSVLFAASIGAALLVVGCNAKHEAAESAPARQETASANKAAFSLSGGWHCRHPMKAAPGFFMRAYHFGSDNVFATAGKDGENTILVAGAYQLSGDQQSLRWIEGTMAAFSPAGEVLLGWRVSQPGGAVMSSNFRDRQTHVRVTDANNIVLTPMSITSGPGGLLEQPNPPDDIPCSRQGDATTEQAWRAVPRPLIAQMLSLYAMNPIPQLDLSHVQPVTPFPQPAVTAGPSQNVQVTNPAVAGQAYKYSVKTTLTGTVATLQGKAANGDRYPYQLLILDKSISVQADPNDPDSPAEVNVGKLHLSFDETMRSAMKRLDGAKVTLEGSLMHAFNGNHFTNVLFNITRIAP